MKKYYYTNLLLTASAAVVFASGIFSCKQKQELPPGEVAVIEAIKSNIKKAREALNENPDNGQARRNLVIYHKQLSGVFENQGRLEEAILEERKALKIDPDNLHSRFRLGEVYLKKGDYLRAANELESLASDNPLYSGQLYAYLGDAYMHLNKIQQARQAYYKALDFNPFALSIYKDLAEAYQKEGNLSEAQKQESMAEQIQEWGFVDRGFKDKSLKEWEKILEEDPFNPLALYNVACYYELNMDPTDYNSINKTLMAWQRYLEGTRGQAARHGRRDRLDEKGPGRGRAGMDDQFRQSRREQDRYHKGIRRLVHGLKRKKGLMARELKIKNLEELQGACKTSLAKIDLLERMMNDAGEFAAESGKPDLQARAEALRKRLEAIGIQEFKEKLSGLLGNIKAIVQKRIKSPDSTPEKELHLSFSAYLKEYQAISEELQETGISELELEVRKLAAQLGMRGYRPMRHFQDF
jgi:tetratricopeptide (TPR) repeat protein